MGASSTSSSVRETPAFLERAAARAREAATASVRPFFEPRVVAVVRANRTRGKIGAEVFYNLRARPSFAGTVVPVNPRTDQVDGVRAYPSVSAIPGEVDLAVVVVPAPQVLAVVDDCIGKRVKAVVVLNQPGEGARAGPAGGRCPPARRAAAAKVKIAEDYVLTRVVPACRMRLRTQTYHGPIRRDHEGATRTPKKSKRSSRLTGQ